MTDFKAEIESDPEVWRKRAEFEAQQERRLAPLYAAEQPIVNDLRAAGYDVRTTLDLGNSGEPYPSAIPVLLRHLRLGTYPDEVVEWLARALGVKEAVPYWQELRDFYLYVRGPSAEEGLAAALAMTARKKHLDDLIGLVADESRGDIRLLFFRPIKRFGGVKGRQILESYQDHPLLGKEARAQLARYKS